jgi:glycerol uptake facilitator-like aquaporin
VTIARSLSDTFAGIAPAGVAAFIAAQLLGAAIAVILSGWLWKPSAEPAGLTGHARPSSTAANKAPAAL